MMQSAYDITTDQIKLHEYLIIRGTETLKEGARILHLHPKTLKNYIKDVFGKDLKKLKQQYKQHIKERMELELEPTYEKKIIKCQKCGEMFETDVDAQGIPFLRRCPKCHEAETGADAISRWFI